MHGNIKNSMNFLCGSVRSWKSEYLNRKRTEHFNRDSKNMKFYIIHSKPVNPNWGLWLPHSFSILTLVDSKESERMSENVLMCKWNLSDEKSLIEKYCLLMLSHSQHTRLKLITQIVKERTFMCCDKLIDDGQYEWQT